MKNWEQTRNEKIQASISIQEAIAAQALKDCPNLEADDAALVIAGALADYFATTKQEVSMRHIAEEAAHHAGLAYPGAAAWKAINAILNLSTD